MSGRFASHGLDPAAMPERAEIHAVEARSAMNLIMTETAIVEDEEIVTGTAMEIVVAGTTMQIVIARAALQIVVACFAVDEVLTKSGGLILCGRRCHVVRGNLMDEVAQHGYFVWLDPADEFEHGTIGNLEAAGVGLYRDRRRTETGAKKRLLRSREQN